MRTKLRSRLTLLFMSFALLLAMPAMALADVTIDTSVDLGTSATTPTNVNVGANNFTIKVWGSTGNYNASQKSGTVTVGNAYSMSTNGTITQTGTTDVKLPDINYSSDCPTTGAPVGCLTNPIKVPATLTVAAGAADGTAGLLQITQSVTSTSGITVDQSPAKGNVKVVVPQAQKQNQTITFGALANKTFGDANFNVSATASSGLAVSFAATGNCSIDANNAVTITGAGNCDITASQVGNANYNAAPNVVQGFTILKKTATVDLSNLDQGYDGSAKSVGASTTNPAGLTVNVTYDGSTTAPINAGSYAVVANVSDNNYQGSATGTLVIDKATPQITWNNPADITYGTQLGAAQLNASANVDGSFSYTPSAGTKLDAGANQNLTADFTPSDTGNYKGASKTVQINVDKAATTTTVTCTAGPFTYNGSAQTPCTVSVTGAGGLDLAPNANYSNNTNAGTATASYTYAGGANHTGSNDSKTFQIDPKALTGSFTAENKVYDGNTNATISGYTLSGKIAGDDVGLDVHGGQFSDKNVANGKSVTVNAGDLTGTERGNYVLASGPWTTTANITPLSITGSFTAADKVYDGNANAAISGRALQGAINGDVVSLSGGSATFNDKNVANGKPVSGTGFTLAGTDKGNYTLGSVSNTTASITAKSVTGSFTAADKVYDGNDSATVTGRTLPGAIAGDDVKLDGGTAKFSNKNVASAKPVTLTGASLVGADKGNYTLGSVSNAEADITARGLTVGATGIDKVYDGTASATVNLSTNELSGDAVRASYAGASFANKNVGTGKLVSVNGISISGADAANYSLTNATASTAADITARGLVVTAKAANKVYDGTTDATVSLSDNRVSGDVLSTSYASASFDNANAGTGKVVTVSGIMVAGADSGNYTFNTSTTTSADIAKRAITVTADAKSKLFGDADPALTYQVSGGPLVSGDGFSGNLSRDPGEAPGQYSILQGSVSAGPNYAVNYVGAKLTIGAWTTKGFYAPVDMLDSTGKYIVNTVKGGSTVPMKFELFKGATELKDVSAVKSTTYSSSSYCGGAVSDEIEVVMTGSTSLRYDATGDQFIYNWKTPTGAGCYKMTMTAQDGSQLIAYFKTR